MIKRIYYYFKLKELLKKSELMPFVKYLMRLQHRSLFQMCMQTKDIRRWFDDMVIYETTYHNVYPKAQRYAQYNCIIAERVTQRFFKAQDIWKKTVKVY